MPRPKHTTFLVNLLKRNNHDVGAEVGVFRGDTTVALIEELPFLQHLITVDPFVMYGDLADASPNKKFRETDFGEVKKVFYERIKKYNKVTVTHFEDFSELIVGMVRNDYLDFVFIDGNHAYKYVKRDIELWAPKVRQGGIVAGHDYKKKPGYGVIRAVNEYFGRENVNVHSKSSVWYSRRP